MQAHSVGKPKREAETPTLNLGFKILYLQRYCGGIKPRQENKSMPYKPALRRQMREQRRNLDSSSITKAAEQVAAKIITLPQFLDSQYLAAYIAQEGELDPTPILHIAAQLNKKIFLPTTHSIQEKSLQFYSYQLGDTLQINQFGILEPLTNERTPIEISTLNIVLIPLVAFDENCNRIGRGAGYYDKTFILTKERSTKKPLLIGLAYEFQKTTLISPAAWDVPMDLIITEKNIYRP